MMVLLMFDHSDNYLVCSGSLSPLSPLGQSCHTHTNLAPLSRAPLLLLVAATDCFVFWRLFSGHQANNYILIEYF